MPLLGKVLKRAIKVGSRTQKKPHKKPVHHQQKVLKRLVKAAKDTSFGTFYDFNEVLKSPNLIKAFQKNVPLFDYNKIHDEWWHKALNDEPDVCWPGHIKYFALSSGTSEATSKYIPVTKEMIKSINKASKKLLYTIVNYDLPSELYEKGILMLGSSTELSPQKSYFVGDMSGISGGNIPSWLNKFYKPGKDIAKTQDWEDKLQQIATNAPDWDIGIICGIPSWIQIMLERIMEVNKVTSIHHVWPNLKIYVHGGISFEPYRKAFDQLFSKPMFYSETYMASEGFFGFKRHAHAEGISLVLNNGVFYEFIPFNDQNFKEGVLCQNPEIHTLEEVQEGLDYAVVISTCAGAWRYLIGDTIQFIDKQYYEFKITGRTKHFLSICGEHLSVDNMNTALQLTANKMNVNVQEFTVQGVPVDKSFGHQWYVGTREKIDQGKFTELLDAHLRAVNDDYATERDNVLKSIDVKLVHNDLFFKWLKTQGKEGDQIKFPRVMTKELFSDWEEFIGSSN